jgi:hypothetical protein
MFKCRFDKLKVQGGRGGAGAEKSVLAILRGQLKIEGCRRKNRRGSRGMESEGLGFPAGCGWGSGLLC